MTKGEMSILVDHRRDRTENLMYHLNNLESQKTVFLWSVPRRPLPCTLKLLINAAASRTPDAKTNSAAWFFEQDAFDDGTTSFSKTRVTFL